MNHFIVAHCFKCGKRQVHLGLPQAAMYSLRPLIDKHVAGCDGTVKVFEWWGITYHDDRGIPKSAIEVKPN